MHESTCTIGSPCSSQVLVLHSFVVVSKYELVASTVPSGEKSNEEIQLECASILVSNSPVSLCQMMTLPLSPLATNRPSHGTANLHTRWRCPSIFFNITPVFKVPQTKCCVVRARNHPMFIRENGDCSYAFFMAIEPSQGSCGCNELRHFTGC